MLLSRWKLMAGVLGVSLGGLAAVAGQCPKSDTKTTTRRHAEPPEAEVPLLPSIPSGGTPTAKAPELPPAPALPAAPAVTLPAPAGAAELPPLPGAPEAPVKAPEPAKAEPALPAPPVVPASGIEPKPVSKPEPASKPTLPAPAPAAPELPDVKAAPVPVTKPAPAGTTPDFPVTTFVPPAAKPADPVIEPKPEPKPEVKPASATVAAPAVAAAAASKYRILLRVGEGEPTFEVKCGDDLVLKVVCEKIDIKSPEKGSGPSAVQARGKVRFVGFGAEGTCEDLAFLAGTGEVTLAGAVKIQVKDKLGRIESELSTETMKYKIDPSAVLTGGKP